MDGTGAAAEFRADDLAPDTASTLAARAWLYRATTAVLAMLLALGVVDLLGWLPAYGVSSATVHDAGGGYELTVQYGTVSRPALATPFVIEVSRPDGFDGPVAVAVDQHYLAMWDLNGIVPAPASERIDGRWVRWEFDPPAGTTLRVVYDGRIEPAQQWGRNGAVAVIAGGIAVAGVEFTTHVRP